MIYVLLALTLLAVGLHIYIFYLETIAWVSPSAQKIFKLTKEEVQQTKAMAANQGVYNLLLAIIALVGLLVYFSNESSTGLALVIAGCGSMSVAALYLLISSDKKSAAVKQLVFPLLATIVAGLLLSVA